MLSTAELEEYIKNEVTSRLGGDDLPLKSIYFEEGNECSSEGVYLFTKDNKYHYLETEKGKIMCDDTTVEVEEILYRIVGVIILNLALDSVKGGESFRREFHEKQIELFSLFGEEFKARKCKEIEEILRKHPYEDEELK